ncbi:MAG: L,D-transpeptidase [Clostridium sp.]|uniref:L,D-transpeptidase n=1 Tax=Clostridium sp. TaxID=1506 RepID=UPI0039E99A78
MYKKSFKFLSLTAFILVCFFTLILSFNVKGIENTYKEPKNKPIGIKDNKAKSTNVKILGNTYSDKEKSNEIVDSINNKNLKPKNYKFKKIAGNYKKKYTNVYKVVVHIGSQTVDVYNNNDLIKTMVCSTGIDSAPTPTGTFVTGNKGTSFFSDKYGEGGYYWTSFWGNYLFHSVPFDKDKNIIQGEVAKLGEKASHGCVRLSVENAKWIYNNIPRNTKVYVET